VNAEVPGKRNKAVGQEFKSPTAHQI